MLSTVNSNMSIVTEHTSSFYTYVLKIMLFSLLSNGVYTVISIESTYTDWIVNDTVKFG